MANFIPEDKIEEIKNAADIVEVVSEYVLLKKTGRNYNGLCPFHSEKTPSFTVSPEKQIFHCFGCNTGGNVFSFLMKQDGLSFPESVRFLARRYGIDLPRPEMTGKMRQQISEREQLFKVNRYAMDFFHGKLVSGRQGEKAMAYLKRRGFSRKIIDTFHLGYAPDAWDGLLNFLQHKHAPVGLIEKAGLVIARKDRSGFYDRFRNRIIFPILNMSRQTVGFGGRVMDDSLPKYLNSPETPVYNKRRLLYGLYAARNKCREEGSVHIVEGYFDQLALYQRGVENTAATLGTALTPEHIHLMKGFVKKAVLIFDSDEAGIKASERSVGMFVREGVEAHVVMLPKGHDPDSFISEFGPEAFYKLTESALEVMSFLLLTAEKKHGLTVSGKLAILEDLRRPLASIKDANPRQLYVKELSERLGIDEAAVLEKVREAGAALKREREIQARRADRFPPVDQNMPPSGEFPRKKQTENRLEQQVVSMMLQFPEMLSEIEKSNVLEYFMDETLLFIGKLVMDHPSGSEKGISNLMSMVDDAEKRNILASLSIKEEMWNQRDCRKIISKLISHSPKRHEISLKAQISAAERENNQELVLKLLGELHKITVLNRKQMNDVLREQ
ncbi:MAG: DNA primase [Thermodesulfobacteriota bacterium]